MLYAAQDQRRHRIQMRPEELRSIETVVHRISRWKPADDYTWRRMDERNVTEHQVLETLASGSCIEINYIKDGDVRVLFRKDFGWYSVCVAASLTNRLVITTFRNKKGDKHRTLDMSKYKLSPQNFQRLMQRYCGYDKGVN